MKPQRSGYTHVEPEQPEDETPLQGLTSPALQYSQHAADGAAPDGRAVGTSPTRRLAYGYMRVFCDVTDDQAYAMEQAIRHFAQATGFQVTSIFHEVESGSHEAFYELGEALRRTDVHDVVLPSLHHLSTNRALQGVLLDCLEESFQADVHVLKSRTAQGGRDTTETRSIEDGPGPYAPDKR